MKNKQQVKVRTACLAEGTHRQRPENVSLQRENMTLEKLKFTVAERSVGGDGQGCGWRGQLGMQTAGLCPNGQGQPGRVSESWP